jgi:hypothetical protein
MRPRLDSASRSESARATDCALRGSRARAHQPAHDLRHGALHGLGLQAVAAEEVDLLQLREEPARAAALHALDLVDLQGFPGIGPGGIELGAGEVSGDQEHIALDPFPARGSEPIGAAAFHQLDEFEALRRKETAERLALVGGVDGDGADDLPAVAPKASGPRRAPGGRPRPPRLDACPGFYLDLPPFRERALRATRSASSAPFRPLPGLRKADRDRLLAAGDLLAGAAAAKRAAFALVHRALHFLLRLLAVLAGHVASFRTMYAIRQCRRARGFAWLEPFRIPAQY